jgi:hypothetical protein
LSILIATIFSPAIYAQEEPEITILKNDKIVVKLQQGSLISIHDIGMDRTVKFRGESCRVDLAEGSSWGTGRTAGGPERGDHTLTYTYSNGGLKMRVVYELKPGWRFFTRQLFFSRIDGGDFFVKKIEMFAAMLENKEAYNHSIDRDTRVGGVWAILQRFTSPDDKDHGYGVFYLIQNPKMKWSRRYSHKLLLYEPEMAWKGEDGDFVSDRLCIGIHPLNGTLFPAHPIAESNYQRDTAKTVEWAEKVDIGEILALQECVRAFLMFKPEKSARIHVGWCENDYQIDVGTSEGRTEYKRIINAASELGVENIVYGPANSKVSSLEENRDAWQWENVLWLGMGQKVRKDEWDPATDPLHPSITEMLDYAKSKNVKLMGYVYPTLAFMQNPQWTAWTQGHARSYNGADMGERSFQDWFIKKLVDFQKSTGAGGFSFDHWYLNAGKNPNWDPGTSDYAQWNGMRRLVDELRRQIPDIVMDGRQSTQWYGPWTYLSGMYPHPFGNDEQPASFKSTADLHTDRLSANHTRAMNWMFSMQCFCPIEVVPGFITHQTQRSDAEGKMHRSTFRTRDWDYLGWRYSMISSIATAPFNHVVSMIPARDEDEFKAFSGKNQAEFRKWLDWCDRELPILRNVRPIIGPPMIDRIDGTAAFDGANGYIFLFNPNYQKMNAKFTLDHAIGLTEGEAYLLTEIHPQEGRTFGKPGSGFWARGDEVAFPMEGARAVVLKVTPVAEVTEPILFNAAGQAKMGDSKLRLLDVAGEVGTETELLVAIPEGKKVRSLTINGKKTEYQQSGNVLSADVRFSGDRFGHSEQVGEYDRDFNADVFKGEFSIPKRVFKQLNARKKAWPVPYTEDDLIAPWVAPWRLLLFVNIADAKPEMDVTMKIDGEPIEMRQAFNGIYKRSGDRTFMGFYADISHLQSDKKYRVEVDLPDLHPGQFHGLYFENIETEYTQDIR